MDTVTDASVIDSKPLTNWKNPPSLLSLKQDLEEAKPSFNTQKTKIATWLDNLHVRNKAKVAVPKGNSQIVPKLIRKQAEWRYPALSEPFLSTEDVFKVKPVTWADKKAALQNQLVLNHQFNVHIDKVKFIDDYTRAAVDEGTVIVRVGWEFEEGEYEEDVPVIQYIRNDAFAQTHDEIAQKKEQSPNLYEAEVPEELKTAHELSIENGFPVEPKVIGMKREKKARTIVNRPTVEVCNYQNVIIDPTCRGDIKKARFAIYSFESCLADLKKDKKYKNLDRVNVQGNAPLSQPDHAIGKDAQNFNFRDKPRQKFVVHEYWGWWDIDGTGLVKPIVAAWVGDTLIRLEENPYPDKSLPFVVAQYLPVRESLYGEPDGELLEDNQKIIGAVTRGMIDIMGKSANGQTGIRKDMLDVTNRRKFENGQDYEFNMNVDPRQGIFMHTYPEIPQSAQYMLQVQNMEAESLTGVKSFATTGISGAALGDVATGVRGALDAASKRELGILRRLAKGIIEIGRKIIAMNAEFLSDKEVVRITDEEFVTVHRDDLPGNFDLKLSISTAEEDNNKAQELAFMLQTTGPNEDPELRKMLLAEILRLRKMPEFAKQVESYQPQPDPLAVQKQQMELALIQADIDAKKAQAQYYLAQAQLGGAKSQTEEVKQGHLKSDMDLKNLEFVEQESGVHQERELQRIGEQARSQAQLKLIDHGMQREQMDHELEKTRLLNKKQ